MCHYGPLKWWYIYPCVIYLRMGLPVTSEYNITRNLKALLDNSDDQRPSCKRGKNLEGTKRSRRAKAGRRGAQGIKGAHLVFDIGLCACWKGGGKQWLPETILKRRCKADCGVNPPGPGDNSIFIVLAFCKENH